jgi:hypothetical protein
MDFCTAINCMDGRTQLPVNAYLRELLDAPYVDTITEPGPVRILAEEPDSETTRSILHRLDISVHKHGSRCIGIVAHHDCTGNPAPEARQREQLDLAVRFIAAQHPGAQVLGLWVDAAWTVTQVCSLEE